MNRNKQRTLLRNKGKNEDKRGRSGDKSAEKPVSLHPLEFEEAVKNLLRVKDLRGKLGRNDGETID